MNDAVKAIIARFLTLFGEPKTDDVQRFMAEYAEQFQRYDERFIKPAGDLIVREHQYQGWPTVGVCVRACDRIAAQHAPRSAELWETDKTYFRSEISEDEKRVADQIMAEFRQKMRRAIGARTPNALPISKDAWEARFGKPGKGDAA